MARRIGFIGAGKLATGLALALQSHGYEIPAVASRSPASAKLLASLLPGAKAASGPSEVANSCDVVFITTPDSAIEQVAGSMHWQSGQGVVHCSGALSLEVLASASAAGASVASFHPLQTLSCIESPEEAAERLSGICYALEADGWLSDWLELAAHDLGGHTIRLAPEDRALYHQAAVFACGYVSALLDAAEEMWVHLGLSSAQARAALAPLAQTTVSNFGRVGSHASVTGPVPRGDVATVERQLSALRTNLPGLTLLASHLGLRSLAFAPADRRQALASALQLATQQIDASSSNTPAAPTSGHSAR